MTWAYLLYQYKSRQVLANRTSARQPPSFPPGLLSRMLQTNRTIKVLDLVNCGLLPGRQHFSSNIYIWHCPPCASMTAAQWAISIVNPLGRISTRIIYHCHPLSAFVFLDVRCSGWMRAQRLCCPAFKNQVA